MPRLLFSIRLSVFDAAIAGVVGILFSHEHYLIALSAMATSKWGD